MKNLVRTMLVGCTIVVVTLAAAAFVVVVSPTTTIDRKDPVGRRDMAAFQTTELVGEASALNGRTFDDRDVIGSDPKVLRIGMRSGNRVDQVSFTWTSLDQVRHGGIRFLEQSFGGSYEELSLQEDESVQEVKLCVGPRSGRGPRERLVYASFTTSQGNTLQGGTQTNSCSSFTAPPGYAVVGVYGRANDEVQQLGLIYGPNRSSYKDDETVKSRGLWEGPYPMTVVATGAANLADGRILAWSAAFKNDYSGGRGKTWTTTFDPESNTSTERLVENTEHDAFCPGTAVLPNSRIMISGGSDAGKTTFYDPVTDTWSKGGEMVIPRAYQANTVLPDGKVFTLGGSWREGQGPRLFQDGLLPYLDYRLNPPRRRKDGEIWSPDTDTWSLVENVVLDKSFVTRDRQGQFRDDNHMWLFTAPNGKVFHAGPATQTHWINVEGDGSTSKSVKRGRLDAMNGNAVMYDIGKLLVLGGARNYQDDSIAQKRAYVFDLNDGDKVSIERVGDMHSQRAMQNSAVLPTGEVIVIGGLRAAVVFDDRTAVFQAEIWSPKTKKFTKLDFMQTTRTYHSTALLMKDGRVWAGGGGLCGECLVNRFSAEILTPPYLLNDDGTLAERPVITSASSYASPGDLIDVSTDSVECTFALIRLNAVTHSVNNDGRRIPLEIESSRDTEYSLFLPSNPAVSLPGTYFLFAMNKAQVPSVASVVTVRIHEDTRNRNLADHGESCHPETRPCNLDLSCASNYGDFRCLFASELLSP